MQKKDGVVGYIFGEVGITEFKFAVDGVISPRTVYVTKPTNGVDIIEISASGIVSATANQVLTIHAGGDGTSSGTAFTPLESGLQVLYLD